MDYTCIDVGGIPGVSVGDRVTLVGSQGEQRITLEEVAGKADTIAYEISCSIGKRVERIYVGGEGVDALFGQAGDDWLEAGGGAELWSARRPAR